jgi:hypothetical protein
LRAEQVGDIAKVAALAVDDQLVRQPARLGTLATVGTATAEGFARQALPAVRHAQCPVNKHFQRQRRLGTDRADFVDRQFPSHDALMAEMNLAISGNSSLNTSVLQVT